MRTGAGATVQIQFLTVSSFFHHFRYGAANNAEKWLKKTQKCTTLKSRNDLAPNGKHWQTKTKKRLWPKRNACVLNTWKITQTINTGRDENKNLCCRKKEEALVWMAWVTGEAWSVSLTSWVNLWAWAFQVIWARTTRTARSLLAPITATTARVSKISCMKEWTARWFKGIWIMELMAECPRLL